MRCALRFSLVAACVVFGSVRVHAGLIITPSYESSLTNDPNFATIQNTINTAIGIYEAAITNPINVSIAFFEMTSGLGQSETFIGDVSYAQYRAGLASHMTSSDDATALAHLPGGASNPVNGGPSVTATTSNLRALGVNALPPAGNTDSRIGLNISLMNLTRGSIDPNKYDLQAVAMHEINEALGFGSGLNSSPGDVFPEDLFRYDQNGARSFTANSSAQSYFSIDGGSTLLVQFNQGPGGDFADWFSLGPHTPRVQDAFGTPGATPDLNLELRALDVIGYDLAIPEPATMLLLGAGLMFLGLKRKTSR